MRLTKCMLILALTLGLSACANNGIEGRYSYSSTIDYSDLKHFVLMSVDEGIFRSPQSAVHYRQAMVSALAEKGFTENPQNPDFAIKTLPIESYREEFVTIDAGRFQLPRALLRVNFIHPSSGEHIYEAVADAFYHEGASQEERNTLIEGAVGVILTGFPPGRE